MIIKEIKKTILDDYRGGATQKELAEKYNVSQQYIALLISGKQTVDNMALKTFLKMFPSATINLHGDSISGHLVNNGHNSGVMGINNGTITQSCFDAVADKILNTSDLTAEEKVKFLSVLRK